MKSQSPCTSYAPGRALPINECERCGHMRHEHEEKHRSLPSGHQGVPPALMTGPAAPRIEIQQEVLYCRACSAGLIIKPPHDPETWPCPQCGHAGAKSKFPINPMPDENLRQQVTPALEVPPELAAIAKAHDEVRAELATPAMQAAEQQVEATILAEKVAEVLMPWTKSDTLTEVSEGEQNDATG